MNRRLLVGIAAMLAAGCSSTTNQPAVTGSQAVVKPEKRAEGEIRLEPGMTQGQVRKLLGEPEAVRPVNSPEGKAEVWVYRRPVSTNVALTAIKTEDRPYFDPFTGVMKTIQEPVYQQEQITVVEELQLLWFDETLINWKKLQKGERSFY